MTKGHINDDQTRDSCSSDPANLIRIFDDAQKYRCQLSHETRELLRGHFDSIDEEFRRSRSGQRPFFSILKWKDAVYETLLEMHRGRRAGRVYS